jgi:hypothetical protein
MSAAIGAAAALVAMHLGESDTGDPGDPQIERRIEGEKAAVTGASVSGLKRRTFVASQLREHHSELGEDDPTAGEQGETDSPAGPSDEKDPLAFDEAALEKEHWANIVRNFEEDPREPRWASEAESAIEGGLANILQDSNGRVVEAECRSSMCSVRVDWPTRQLAVQAIPDLLHRSAFALNCARQLHDSQMETATLIFRCDEGLSVSDLVPEAVPLRSVDDEVNPQNHQGAEE